MSVLTYQLFNVFFYSIVKDRESRIQACPIPVSENWESICRTSFQYQLFIILLQVHVLMCVDSPYIVDRISFELPLMKQMGDSVQMEVTSVRPYEAFYDDLEKLA